MSDDRGDFAQLVMAQVAALGEIRSVRHDDARDRLVLGEPPGPVHFVHLGHARADWLNTSTTLATRAVIGRVWSAVQNAGPGSITRERLFAQVFPRIRDRAWFSAIRRQAELELGADEGAIDELMLPYEPLNDELAVHLAFELPTSVMEVGPDRLEAWGVTFEQLYARALDNLRARSQLTFEEPEPGIFISPYHDTLDASRMALLDTFSSLAVKGRPVVLAPTHDVVLVTGDEDEAGLARVATWCEEAILEPRVNTAVAFRLEGDSWRPWLPHRTHPAWGKLKLLALQTYASVYQRQKEVLEALLNANGHAMTVGPLRVFRTPAGEIITSSTWHEGRETLLPRTDRIEFARLPHDGNVKNAKTWSTSWEAAERRVGHLMKPTGDVPERYRVTEFPDDATLELLAADGRA